MAYDFTTLDPNDFEALVADVLSKSWGSRLESFKPGKDGGIDLRHSRVPSDQPETIVQCKRYAPGAFPSLLRSCKKEQANLKELEPTRYVLATSCSLSPANKDALVAALSPWCVSATDVYGPDEINGLLRQFPDIERAHFKLWISSTAVLERVLHARVFSITDATVDLAKRQLSKLVVHDGFSRALDLLNQRHHVLIVGNPGIGKTTLARMLMCHYLQEGFEPVRVVSNIEDAWTVIHGANENDRRLVIVYDDFLGRLQFDSLRFGKNEELSLMDLLDKAARSSSLRLILTTREYIMEDAKRIHGAFGERSNELLKYTLSLADYSTPHRAQMLFNHLYFSDLPDSRLEKVLETKVYRRIINNQQFNPRIVESICNQANSHGMSDDDFISFINKEFEEPSRLWAYPFRHEIGPMAQHILFALWTFRGTAEMVELRNALEQSDATVPADRFGLDFDDALRQLNGNFISTERYPIGYARNHNVIVVQFQNPSVEEFVEGLIITDDVRLSRVVSYVVSERQVARLLEIGSRPVRANRLSRRFWETLRIRAAEVENVRSGYLVHYRSYGETTSRLTWLQSPLSAPARTMRLLDIDNRLGICDSRAAALRLRVLTNSGWMNTISQTEGDESIARDTLRLQEWVIEKSGWTGEEKLLSQTAYRGALRQFLAEHKGWPISAASLYSLAKAATLLERELSDEISRALLQAANDSASTLMADSDEHYQLSEEADALSELTEFLPENVDTLVGALRARAEEMEREDEEAETDKPESHRYSEGTLDQFDIDRLFAGLLDR
jgi:hypothetical protein